MKRILALLLIVAFAVVPFAEAQQASPGAAVTQTGSTGLAASNCIQSTGTASTALTITLPQAGGANSVYIDYLVLTIASTAAVTSNATPPVFTSTNLPGLPSWPVSSVVATGALNTAAGANGSLAIPIKALAGTAPTIVGPTANTNFFDIMTVCWHVAP